MFIFYIIFYISKNKTRYSFWPLKCPLFKNKRMQVTGQGTEYPAVLREASPCRALDVLTGSPL
jgi:hypothetical protein